MRNRFIIEICPHEPRASIYTIDGGSAKDDPDVIDCTGPGDAEDACRCLVGLSEFRIVAENANGSYENRLATDSEMIATAEAIYFESETDFTSDDMARVYLAWEAASNAREGE